MTNELAEILGLLCSEGCHVVSYSNYWEKDREKLRYRSNKKSERIEFYNKDEKLLFHYSTLLFKEFGIITKKTKFGKINIGNRAIIKAITEYTHLGHLKWQVPALVINGSKKVKISFLRGFFDGDGTVSNNNIRIFSTNKTGLIQIMSVLNDLKFEHSLRGPELKADRKPLYYLRILSKARERFLKQVNPISKRPGMRG